MVMHIDFNSDIPIYQQIRNQIVVAIADGRLMPGEKLPTIRGLAEESGINMMTVSKAYQLLKQEGYIHTDRRSGAVIRRREETRLPAEETVKGLRLRLSELRLAGWSREEVLVLCENLYEEANKK